MPNNLKVITDNYIDTRIIKRVAINGVEFDEEFLAGLFAKHMMRIPVIPISHSDTIGDGALGRSGDRIKPESMIGMTGMRNDNVAVPIIDRIIHHSHVFMLGGMSPVDYRQSLGIAA